MKNEEREARVLAAAAVAAFAGIALATYSVVVSTEPKSETVAAALSVPAAGTQRTIAVLTPAGTTAPADSQVAEYY